MKGTVNKILDYLRSPRFFKWIMVVFLAQAALFAVIISPSHIEVHSNGSVARDGGVIPDGNRHIGAIYLFAEEPLLISPFTLQQTADDLWIGDLERFPSYFYYYVLSGPIKLTTAMGAPDWVNVGVIRVIGIVFGALALVVFRRIVRELQVSESVINVSSLALALTGSFAWLAPAENYDVMALLVFFLFVLAAVQLFARRQAKYIYWMALWFFIGSITKYTYLPFMGLAGLVSVGLYFQAVGWRAGWGQLASWTRQFARKHKWLAGLGVVVLLASGGMFVERIGGNLVQYQSFSPNCAVVHNHEDCMSFGVYSRNHNRAMAVDEGRVGWSGFNPVSYYPEWLQRYYSSMYAYVGHIWIESFHPLLYIGGVAATAMTVLAYIYTRLRRGARVLINRQLIYILGLITVLVIAQLAINTMSYINYEGLAYAHQGRYLLPAIGFVYVFSGLILQAAYRAAPYKRQIVVAIILLVVAGLSIVAASALPSFFMHADSSTWYSEFARNVLSLPL